MTRQCGAWALICRAASSAALELGPDPDAGGDLLGEDLVAADAERCEGVELGLEFLAEV